MNNKIVTVVGARPQFIKASVVTNAFSKKGLREVMIHTGQHFDENMSHIFFQEMGIPEPAYNLDIHGLSHGAMTGRMLEETEKILQQEKPAMMVVYGDTNSTLAGALAAQKLHIPVAHIEAGLRSFNMKMPEEVNRILTDRIATMLFCPTKLAVKNLMNEGFDNFPAKVLLSGDVMQDAAFFYTGKARKYSTVLSRLSLNNKLFILCTFHRQENTDDPEKLSEIVAGLNELSQLYQVVLPIHPRTRKIISESGLRLEFEPVDPVGFLDMMELLEHCTFVVTDSGGLQKEAFFHKKYCITLRDETEWMELVDAGVNFLAGADKNLLLDTASKLKHLAADFNQDLYGGGKAAEFIANEITAFIR
jgi:UDP-GlcNAc3NAcA epimerase